MSFMTIHSIILHCHECNSYSEIDFVGGSRWTQIGVYTAEPKYNL